MSRLLFGSLSDGEIFQPAQSNLSDDGTPVCLRAITGTWAPAGWMQTALYRTVTLNVSSNVGATVRVTPILQGVALDGTSGNPDCRITFVIAVPSAGNRTESRNILGLSRPVSTDLGNDFKVGLRGSWVNFLVETVGEVDASNGETNPDFRAEAVSIEPVLLGQTQQVRNA